MPGGQMLDHRRPGWTILEQRGDVLEENAFGGKVFDIANFCSEGGHIHNGRRSYACHSRDATPNSDQVSRRRSTSWRRSVTTRSECAATGVAAAAERMPRTPTAWRPQ